MAEECHATHVGDAHAHDDHHTAGGGPLSEIARIKASRRSFIKGVIASGATLGATGYLFRAGSAQASSVGAVERLLSLKINGQTRRVDVLPHETLANTAALQARPDGHQALLRPRRMRRLHRDHQWHRGLFLHHAHPRGSRQGDHHHRRRCQGRAAAPSATRLHRRDWAAMRLLYARPSDVGRGFASGQSSSHPRRSTPGHVRQPVPVRFLQSISGRRDARRKGRLCVGGRFQWLITSSSVKTSLRRI